MKKFMLIVVMGALTLVTQAQVDTTKKSTHKSKSATKKEWRKISPEQKKEMRAKYKNMSPEEKAAAKEKYKQKKKARAIKAKKEGQVSR